MEASSVPVAPSTAGKRGELCSENDKLLREWIEDVLSRPSKPSLDEKRKIWAEIRKRDPWYRFNSLNSRIRRRWTRAAPENQESANEHAADPSPSNSTIDVTKAIRALLCERIDPSNEHINAWAASLGIEDDVVKAYIKRIRNENGTAKTISCDPFSPQSEVSTAVPHNGNISPTILSPRSGMHATGSTAARPLEGTCNQREPGRESLAVSYSPAVVDSLGHRCGNDTFAASVLFAHCSSSASVLPLVAEGSNQWSRRCVEPSGTTTHNVSETPAVPMEHDDIFIKTPAQVLARNKDLECSARQANDFLYITISPAMSVTDSVDFSTIDRFDRPEPVRDVVPDDNVPRLAGTFVLQDDSDADAPTTTEEFIDKFKPYSDRMDSLLLRIRAVRRDQMHRTRGRHT